MAAIWASCVCRGIRMRRVFSALSRPWQTYRRLSWGHRGMLVEAQALLAAARLVIVLVPFRFYASHLGVHMAESATDELDAARQATLRRIAWAIGAISRRAPWRCLCLEQALAAKMMLRVRRLPNTLYLGVAPNLGGRAEAHAWLRSGVFYVTGGDGRDRYAVVSTFADRIGRR
jgi:Transglutaminase-like superfamily